MTDRSDNRRLAARLLSPALRYLERLGHDAEPALLAVGLPSELLANADQLVSDAQFDRLLDELTAITGDPDFGIHAGEFLRPGDYGLLEVLIGQAATDGDITDLVNRYHGLLGSPGRKPLRDIDGEMTFVATDPDIDVARTAAEYSMVTGLGMARLILGRFDVVSVASFAHDEPEDVSEHHRVFAAELRFNAHHNALSFPLGSLPEINRAVDHSLSDWLLQEATTRLAHLHRASTAADRIREVLRASNGEGFTEKSVAYQLSVSARTMRRQLAAEDTTFVEVRDEIRHSEAQRLLRETDRSLIEIALQLGFADSSGLHRAFKRMEGTTPTQFRQRRPGP